MLLFTVFEGVTRRQKGLIIESQKHKTQGLHFNEGICLCLRVRACVVVVLFAPFLLPWVTHKYILTH